MPATQSDNPPAFPVIAENGLGHVSDGMTLRDWYAGQALVGAMANHGSFGIGNGPGEIAQRCHEIADAMLAARERREGDAALALVHTGDEA